MLNCHFLFQLKNRPRQKHFAGKKRKQQNEHLESLQFVNLYVDLIWLSKLCQIIQQIHLELDY